MIFTSISPNTEADDVSLACKTLLQPWQWKKGASAGMLEQAFKAKFSFSHAYAFQSGRNSLYAILEALDLKTGDEVLLQAYTCVAVPEPVLWAGAKPVYVDADATLTMDPADLSKKITSKARVLVIQHTFGMPARLDELLALARQHNLFVIEDCAHAMGATYKGRIVGSFGDASFFSFGRDKVLSSVFGGIAVIKDQALAAKIEKIQNDFSYPSFFSIKRQLLHPIIMSFAKATYTSGSMGKIIIEASKRIGLIPKAVELAELAGGRPSFFAERMPNAMAILALHQFQKLDRYNEHRKKIAGIYQKKMSASHIQAQESVSGSDSIPLRFTVFISDPRAVLQAGKKSDIELGDWYWQSIAPKRVQYGSIGYDPATCPNAEKLASQSLNLPTHIGITENDAVKVAECVAGAIGNNQTVQ